jgi:hypothetical protein
MILSRSLAFPTKHLTEEEREEETFPIPVVLDSETDFGFVFKVQIIWAITIMAWVTLSTGMVYQSELFAGDIHKNYGEIGVEAFAHWFPSDFTLAFQLPEFPGDFFDWDVSFR